MKIEIPRTRSPRRELELARGESRGPLLAELAAAQAAAERERGAASTAAEEAATVRVEAARAAVDARRHRKEAARWEAHAFTLQQCALAAPAAGSPYRPGRARAGCACQQR